MTLVNGYATRNEVKDALALGTAANDADAKIDNCIGAASRLIDGYCARQFWVTGTAVRVFNADGYSACEIDDVPGTAVTVKTSSNADGTFDVTWAATDYQLEPLNGVLDGLSWPTTRLVAVGTYSFPTPNGRNPRACVQVTSTFGFGTAVPEPVREACILQASRLLKRYDSPLGVAGFGELGAVRVSRFLDPDVQLTLEPYRKVGTFR